MKTNTKMRTNQTLTILLNSSKDVPLRRVKRWGFDLRELLNDPIGHDQFTKFLEKEYSGENLKWVSYSWKSWWFLNYTSTIEIWIISGSGNQFSRWRNCHNPKCVKRWIIYGKSFWVRMHHARWMLTQNRWNWHVKQCMRLEDQIGGALT